MRIQHFFQIFLFTLNNQYYTLNILALKWVKLDADLQDEVQHEISALFLFDRIEVWKCKNEGTRIQTRFIFNQFILFERYKFMIYFIELFVKRMKLQLPRLWKIYRLFDSCYLCYCDIIIILNISHPTYPIGFFVMIT